MDSAKRVISGTWAEVWVDGNRIMECSAGQAKWSHTKQDVPLCGQMATDTKTTATKGTGSLSIYKVYSRFRDYADAVLAGVDKRATVIMKLDDPDAYGAERIALYNVSFDDATLMDFTAGELSRVTCPFTFTGHKYLDISKEQ